MIRLLSLELSHFKNVGFGRIEFPTLANGGSVLGIYGQNGSGKTAVIDAIACVDRLLSGYQLTLLSSDYLEAGASELEIKAVYYLDVAQEESPFRAEVEYRVRLAARDGDTALHPISEAIAMKQEGASRRTLIDHSLTFDEGESSDVGKWGFAPKGRWRSILAFDAECERQYMLAEGATTELGASFLFSKGFIRALRFFLERCRDDEGGFRDDIPRTVASALDETALPLYSIVSTLKRYAQRKLYVLPTARTTSVSFDLMFLTTVASDSGDGRHDLVELDMSEPNNIRIDQFERLRETIASINGVLSALIPGYSVELADLGPVMLDQGGDGRRVELVSNRDGNRIPFRCESEGIQKITSIASLLIDVYNDEDCCVAMDEADSGVFEFLLGELLEVLASKCKGQLIFTAHNLRALETLPPKALVFTTSNPRNRFVSFKGVRPSNNLRDQYLRAINLGGQDEEIYVPTDKLAIDSAFYRAGHQDDPSLDELLDKLRG